jgi:arylsulfate sulfotransferase
MGNGAGTTIRWRARRRPTGRGAWLAAALWSVVALRGSVARGLDASLSASSTEPVALGTMVSWSAAASGDGSERVWYRFRVRERGGRFDTVRDFSPASTLAWTASDHEGTYEVEVTVRDLDGGRTAVATSTIEMEPRAQGATPVVSATPNPLVFLYSDASCRSGSSRVVFYSDDGMILSTRSKACHAGRTLNFYLAGLKPQTAYTAVRVTAAGRLAGRVVTFSTGPLPDEFRLPTVLLDAQPRYARQELLLQAPFNARPFATDLDGNLMWVGPADLSYLTRPGDTGKFFGLATTGEDPQYDYVREFDLVGMTLRETSVARVSEQLQALGRRPISGFHHDARALSGGRILLLASVEQILTDVQGPGPVDVLGDMIVVLDRDLNVVWAWDAFDHLDPHRAAVLHEDCSTPGACAPHYLSPTANDWTHGNSIASTPDGDILYSSRHQDWLVRIAFQDGKGDGSIVWRLGKDGDFAFDATDPYPWFSHQHDGEYESARVLTVFDNGNTRVATGMGSTSRGQALELDEPNRTARLVLNADLGLFSFALGAAERLTDGSYHFDCGWLMDADDLGRPSARSLQVTSHGEVVYSIKAATQIYRSFRMVDMYGIR